jgi:putative transposase
MSTILQSTAGRFDFCHCWKSHFANTSTQWARVGGWTRPTSWLSGALKCLYRAVGKVVKAVDFLLTVMRDKKAAMRFFENATLANGIPEKVAMAKSVANRSAIDQIVEDKDITV